MDGEHRLLLLVNHKRQFCPLSYIVKYIADITIKPSEAGITIDVVSTVPVAADPSTLNEAVRGILRGVERVLQPRRLGAAIRLRDLYIHDVDCSPQKYEQHTAEELEKLLDASWR